MENNNMKTESFIRRTIAFSLVIALFAVSFALKIFAELDNIRFGYVERYIAQQEYDRALEVSETISDSDLRLSGRYMVAQALYEEMSYTDAAQLFLELDDYSDSGDYYLRCSYNIAEGLFAEGLYQEALEAFAAMGDYSDCRERQLQVRYRIAEVAYESEDYSRAVLLFLALEDYEDSPDMAYKATLALTGDPEVAKEMLYSGGVTQEELSKSLKIAERRNVFEYRAIEAGAKHTVLLRTDGTVAACGDNTYGQCDVGEWSDIVQIAVGAYHTVGLRADGTVVAVGKNTNGQCKVTSWKDIKSIAAGDSDTYALTSKGKVISCGYHDYSNIKRAVEVEEIYAGSYAAAARLSTGTYVPSHKTYSMAAEREIVSVGLNTGYTVLLQADGECISSVDAADEWENIVWVDAGSTVILAVDIDGRAKAHFFRKGETVDLSEVEDACQCAAGPEHFVFLHEDGTLSAYGDNTYGQCDVESLGSAFGAQ